MRKTLARLLPALVALVPALLLAGCSGKEQKPETTEVNGTVTYRGQPFPFAGIVFSDGKGQTGRGQVVHGKFIARDVPIGEGIKVYFSTRDLQQQYEQMKQQYDALPAERKDMKKKAAAMGKAINEADLKSQQKEDLKLEEAVEHMGKMMSEVIPAPQKYTSEKETPLKYKIAKGQSDLDIVLED